MGLYVLQKIIQIALSGKENKVECEDCCESLCYLWLGSFTQCFVNTSWIFVSDVITIDLCSERENALVFSLLSFFSSFLFFFTLVFSCLCDQGIETRISCMLYMCFTIVIQTQLSFNCLSLLQHAVAQGSLHLTSLLPQFPVELEHQNGVLVFTSDIHRQRLYPLVINSTVGCAGTGHSGDSFYIP